MKNKSRMKSALTSWAVAVMLLGSAIMAEAGELGHYMPGVASIRDFIVPSDPGFYYMVGPAICRSTECLATDSLTLRAQSL